MDMRVTPINSAEAIIEPFWDPALSGFREWSVSPGEAHGLRVFQNWCWVQFEWARPPASGPALSMTRACDLDCSGYDDLLVSVMAPPGAVLHIAVDTDIGTATFTAPPAPALKKEHAVDLGRARRIWRITLALDAAADGVAEGWLNWIGLCHRALLDRYLQDWCRFDARWDGYLKPESYATSLSFQPAYGLVLGADELEALRQEHAVFAAQRGGSPFVEAGRAAAAPGPESLVGEYVSFWNDTRYNRERDHGRQLLVHGPNAAVAGQLTRDPALLRLAARYALSLAMCGHWDDGMICRFPDGTFDHRCFVQSLCAFESALILDLAGDWFTDLGRAVVLRRLGEEGLGSINYNSWRYDYIFHCNQLAWFTPGRMLAYLVLERHWQHVRPYTELARQELLESLDLAILPDGGYVEGPTYFRCVGRDAGLPLYFYARARGLTLADLIPERMRRCAAFGEAVISTDAHQDMIPVCDAMSYHDVASQAVMALALPGSAWSRMLAKTTAANAGVPLAPRDARVPFMADVLLAWNLARSVTPAATAPAPFVALPDMGVMASTRQTGPHTVKLLLMGNRAGAGHTHEDKGSFVLEFAGETFAMDPGTCDYSSPFAGIAHHCERHNMLIPVGIGARPHPTCPLPVDVKPRGSGDAVRFQASMDVTPGWELFYKKWTRTWDSPAPDRLTITDTYELAQGRGVEFCWLTQQTVTVRRNRITLRGQTGQVEITTPAGTTVRVDELPFHGGVVHRRVVICQTGVTGTLAVEVRRRAIPD